MRVFLTVTDAASGSVFFRNSTNRSGCCDRPLNHVCRVRVRSAVCPTLNPNKLFGLFVINRVLHFFVLHVEEANSLLLLSNFLCLQGAMSSSYSLGYARFRTVFVKAISRSNPSDRSLMAWGWVSCPTLSSRTLIKAELYSPKRMSTLRRLGITYVVIWSKCGYSDLVVQKSIALVRPRRDH